jgi:hypothetical protein
MKHEEGTTECADEGMKSSECWAAVITTLTQMPLSRGYAEGVPEV